ncbi:bacteriocin-like protein [Flavobacteriaceae bacterium M23B6Z8]
MDAPVKKLSRDGLKNIQGGRTALKDRQPSRKFSCSCNGVY